MFWLKQRRMDLQTTLQTGPTQNHARIWRQHHLTFQRVFFRDSGSRRRNFNPPNRAPFVRWPLSVIVLASLFLPGCNALNPLCGSARPVPVIASLSADSITLAQAQQGFLLTVTGKEFVASSVVLINGSAQTTSVQSSSELQVTIPVDLFSAPGTAAVSVQTPSGNSGKLGCDSGGTSSALTLTVVF